MAARARMEDAGPFTLTHGRIRKRLLLTMVQMCSKVFFGKMTSVPWRRMSYEIRNERLILFQKFEVLERSSCP